VDVARSVMQKRSSKSPTVTPSTPRVNLTKWAQVKDKLSDDQLDAIRNEVRKEMAEMDANEATFSIVAKATGRGQKLSRDAVRAAAAALGRRGGLKGGRARAEALTPARRRAIAKKAARARWETDF
jgi:hypothetical protein